MTENQTNSIIYDGIIDQPLKHTTIKNFAEEDKPREKMMLYGPECLSDAELMAILIGEGTRKITAVDLSRQILTYYNQTLEAFLNMHIDELANNPAFKGLGKAKACKILAGIELGRRATKSSKKRIAIKSPGDAAEYLMEQMRYYTREHFEVLLLDTKGQVLRIETVSIGTINASLIHPREVFAPAIRQHAYAVILAHNHPSGDPVPSPDDISTTNRLIECGRIIDIPVLDHIVIGDETYLSLKEEHLCAF